MKYDKENTIWLMDDDKKNIIFQGGVVVTDDKLYSELIEQLRDIDTYICTDSGYYSGTCDDCIEYREDGAVRYKNHGRTIGEVPRYSTWDYSNPRKELYKLITNASSFYRSKDLLDLFATLECGDSREKHLAELKRAKEIISQLEGSSLNSETIKTIIRQMWPNFGYYATIGLDCTDIRMLKSYNIEELEAIVNISKNSSIKITSDAERILSYQELAQSNTKVLSFARRVHKNFR